MDRRPSTTAVFGKPQIDIECSDHECEAMLPPAKVVADDNAATRPLLETLWRSGVCCLLPLLFLYVVALGMMAPRFPGLWRVYARLHAIQHVQCPRRSVSVMT